MKTFNDLEFKKRELLFEEDITNEQALMFFPNGYGVSVLLGKKFYSNGIDTYELAVMIGNEEEYDLCYNTPITNDVLGYLTAEEVTEIMRKIQELN